MASCGGVLVVVMEVGWLAAAQSCCSPSRFAAKTLGPSSHEAGDFGRELNTMTLHELAARCVHETRHFVPMLRSWK